jgi:hypothetical protein
LRQRHAASQDSRQRASQNHTLPISRSHHPCLFGACLFFGAPFLVPYITFFWPR